MSILKKNQGDLSCSDLDNTAPSLRAGIEDVTVLDIGGMARFGIVK